MSDTTTLSPQAAAATVADGGLVAFLSTRDRILATGPDAASYLQGQLSQQIDGLNAGETRWSLLLQPQGKVEAWMRVHRIDEQTFWLDLDSGAGERALARLERFKLRTDAEFTLETTTLLALRGTGSLDVAPTDGSATVLDATWDGLAGVDLLVDEPERWASTNGVILVAGGAGSASLDGPAFDEALRIWQGRPAVGPELDESTIPAAAGIVERSVDFTKGCYVGQELVARVDSRGNNTPTNLHRLSAPEGAALLADQELFTVGPDGSPDDSVGRVTSVAVWPADDRPVGLAYLKRSVTAPVGLITSDGTPVQIRS